LAFDHGNSIVVTKNRSSPLPIPSQAPAPKH